MNWLLMDQGLITYFLSTKSSIALVLKIRVMSRVVSVGGEGRYVVTMTCPVNSYKDNLWLLQEHQLLIQQIFIKCLIGTGHCSRHWDTVVNTADKTPVLREPTRGREDNTKEKEEKRILSGSINSCEVF